MGGVQGSRDSSPKHFWRPGRYFVMREGNCCGVIRNSTGLSFAILNPVSVNSPCNVIHFRSVQLSSFQQAITEHSLSTLFQLFY